MSNFFKRAKTLGLSDTDEVTKYDWQAAVLCYSSFPGSAVKVAMILSSHANRDLLAWPTCETVAFELNWKDDKEVSKATRQLCKHGALEKIKISEIPVDLRPDDMKRKGKGTAYRLSAKWAIMTATNHEHEFMRNSQPEHLKPEKSKEKEPEYGGVNVHLYGGVDVHPYGVQNVHPNTLKKPEGNFTGSVKSQAAGSISDSSPHPCETSIGKSGDIESNIQIRLYVEIRKRLGSLANDPAIDNLIRAAMREGHTDPDRIIAMISSSITGDRSIA